MSVARVLGILAAVTVVFSCTAAVHDAAKAWRCRPNNYATSYERADACRPESWR